MMDDLVAAVERVVEVQKPEQLIVMGHSAGAHLAAMLAFNPDYLMNAMKPAAFIGLSGVYNWSPGRFYQPIFPGDRHSWNPIEHVSSESPSSLLLHGARDITVNKHHSVEIAEALKREGVRAELHIYKLFDHFVILMPLIPLFKHISSLRRDLKHFLDSLMP
jgi:acetyl esterase/lipase